MLGAAFTIRNLMSPEGGAELSSVSTSVVVDEEKLAAMMVVLVPELKFMFWSINGVLVPEGSI
jgi:hypothetical protein